MHKIYKKKRTNWANSLELVIVLKGTDPTDPVDLFSLDVIEFNLIQTNKIFNLLKHKLKDVFKPVVSNGGCEPSQGTFPESSKTMTIE